MSDSYSAWCEEQEKNEWTFSEENVNRIKQTKKFKAALKRAAAACKAAQRCEAKHCRNCIHRLYLNTEKVCEKLGLVIFDLKLICKYWKGIIVPDCDLAPNEDVIAWRLLQKERDEA